MINLICEEAARNRIRPSLYGVLVIQNQWRKTMTQQIKAQKGKMASTRSANSHADQRVIELVKYLARCAAKRDYDDIQSKSAFDGDSHGDTGEDS